MRNRWVVLTALGLALGATAVTTAYANGHESGEEEENEHEVSLASIPQAARDALVKLAAGAPILKAEQATEHGKTTYSVHVKTNQGVIEITVDANGKLLRQGPEMEDD